MISTPEKKEYDTARFYKLKFGVHKGKPLCEVPVHYLFWCVKYEKIYESIRNIIRKYLKELYEEIEKIDLTIVPVKIPPSLKKTPTIETTV